MANLYENYDLIFQDPIPKILFLTEDPNAEQIKDLFTQASLNKNGNKSPRLKIVSLTDLPDFTPFYVDYLGFKLIHENSFITFPGAILLYLDLTAIETSDNTEFISIIQNDVLYFAKDLNSFITNRTKFILILNLNQNAPSASIISSGVKNFDFCDIEHVLFCSSDDLQKIISKAEEYCFNQNNAFCERHIRHLKRLKPSESEMFKDRPHVDPLENDMFLSLRNCYIAHIQQLLKEDKEALKNYEHSWNVMYNSREYYKFDINPNESLDMNTILDSNRFLSVPMSLIDIIAVRDFKSNTSLLDILRQYFHFTTNGDASEISGLHYLYRFSYIHRYVSEQLPQLPTYHNMGLRYVNLKSYHLYMFFKYILLLSTHNQSLDRLVSQNEINALVSVFVDFNNLGWNFHSFVLLVILFKYYLTFNCIPEAIDTFNNLYRNQMFKLPNYINYKLGQESQSDNNILIWKNNWDLYDYLLSLGYSISGNKIEWICSSLKAFKGHKDALNKIKKGVLKPDVLSNFPLDLPLQGRATLYLSDRLLILVFKLDLSDGFNCNSGVITSKNEQSELNYKFFFRSVTPDFTTFRSALVGVLEDDHNHTFTAESVELGLSEYVLFLHPFVDMDHLLKSTHVDLTFYLTIGSNVLFTANVFVTTHKFISIHQLLDNILPCYDRQNVILRSTVKVTPLTTYWIDGLAPVVLDFYIMNFTLSQEEIEISISERPVYAQFISNKALRMGDFTVNHLTFQLNINHDKSLSEHYLLIKAGTFDSCSTPIKYEYHEGLILNYVKEVVSTQSISIRDVHYYTLSALNNTKFPIKINKIWATTELNVMDLPISLLPNESFTFPLNDLIDEDNVFEEICTQLSVKDESILKDVDWISSTKLKVVSINDTFGLDVKCFSDSLTKVGSEFNYEVFIKNNLSTTQELHIYLKDTENQHDNNLLLAGPISINIILLPFDSKKIKWKIVSLIAGQIELPRIGVEKKRWLHTGDEQPFESLPISVSVLPKAFELN